MNRHAEQLPMGELEEHHVTGILQKEMTRRQALWVLGRNTLRLSGVVAAAEGFTPEPVQAAVAPKKACHPFRKAVRGDTLSRIKAEEGYTESVEELAQANHLANPNIIQEGATYHGTCPPDATTVLDSGGLRPSNPNGQESGVGDQVNTGLWVLGGIGAAFLVAQLFGHRKNS
jgi:LysM repeat protein